MSNTKFTLSKLAMALIAAAAVAAAASPEIFKS